MKLIKRIMCRLYMHDWKPRDWQSIKAELIDTGHANVLCCKRCGKHG